MHRTGAVACDKEDPRALPGAAAGAPAEQLVEECQP
jgi:hypothetical protein